jgi:hypothetical protein
MNFRHLGWLFLAGIASPITGRSEFTVHEWGTFTSVHASDGALLTGLEREEHRLPGFVHSHVGFAPADKGWSRPVKNVTIKMETPVLYFYTDQETPLTVDIGFSGGSISQWYPQRGGGEKLPISMSRKSMQALPPIDFAQGYNGSIQWTATVLAPDSTVEVTAPKDWETPQWPRARVAEANRVRTPDGTIEGFLFYRGIGNFELPLQIRFTTDGALLLRNSGEVEIPHVWIYDNREHAGVRYEWEGALAAGESKEVGWAKVHFAADRTNELLEPLKTAGLTEPEAKAMLATWKESYFDAPGLRVFWIVPRTFTDRILPIKITPIPDKLERVLVGRSEVLTPVFERELVDGFRRDRGTRWEADRYFLAYRERARQLGVVLPKNHP